MRIGMFTDSYLPSLDGVATSVAAVTRELKESGHDVFVIAPSQKGELKRKYIVRLSSVRVFKEPETWVGLPIPRISLLKAVGLHIDIIHAHSGGPITIIGWVIAKARNIPVLITYHTMWRYYAHYFPSFGLVKPWMLVKLSVFFGNHSQAMIAPTEKVKRALREYGVKNPIYVIPSGIELDKFRNAKKGLLTDKLPPEVRKDPRILYVGRLEKEKSVDFLLMMFAQVLKKYPRSILVLVGEGRDEGHLKNLAQTLAIDNRVFFVGTFPQDKMPEVYADADIFVFDSKTETQGLVVLEALASGKPVVVVDDPAFKQEVEDKKNGFIVEKDTTIFARKVLVLLQDKRLRKRMGENARRSTEQFSAKNTAKRLEQTYLQILSENNNYK